MIIRVLLNTKVGWKGDILGVYKKKSTKVDVSIMERKLKSNERWACSKYK